MEGLSKSRNAVWEPPWRIINPPQLHAICMQSCDNLLRLEQENTPGFTTPAGGLAAWWRIRTRTRDHRTLGGGSCEWVAQALCRFLAGTRKYLPRMLQQK